MVLVRGVADPFEAYNAAVEGLRRAALRRGGDAVVFARFDHRVAVTKESTMGGERGQVFEVFAYGTAVKRRSPA